MTSPKRKHPQDSPTVRLMKRMRLSGKDLDLNRAGELSDRQKRRLHRGFFFRVFLCTMWALGYVILFVSIMIITPLNRLISSPMTYIEIGAVCAGIWFLRHICKQHLKNVSTGHVVAFTGRVKKHPVFGLTLIHEQDGKTIERTYNENGIWQYSAFLDGETYTIYSPAFDLSRFVSAEHIADQ